MGHTKCKVNGFELELLSSVPTTTAIPFFSQLRSTLSLMRKQSLGWCFVCRIGNSGQFRCWCGTNARKIFYFRKSSFCYYHQHISLETYLFQTVNVSAIILSSRLFDYNKIHSRQITVAQSARAMLLLQLSMSTNANYLPGSSF